MATSSRESSSLWSLSALAREFGIHRATAKKRVEEAGIDPAGSLHGKNAYTIADAARAILAPEMRKSAASTGDDDIDPDQLSPAERRDWYSGNKAKTDAQMRELELEEKARNLVPAHEVAQELSQILKIASSGFESLIDEVEREFDFGPDLLERLQRKFDERRERIYQEYAGEGDEEAG